MAQRDERIARNERRFRAANEKLSSRFAELEADDRATLFICECANERCTELLRMTRGEYDAIHADRARYTIVPGHDVEEAEHVVEQNERFAVVEKTGWARDVALDEDETRMPP